MDASRQVLRVPNKTPLSILHEYAARLNLQASSFLPSAAAACMHTGIPARTG
jgi:hypothetical protein